MRDDEISPLSPRCSAVEDDDGIKMTALTVAEVGVTVGTTKTGSSL